MKAKPRPRPTTLRVVLLGLLSRNPNSGYGLYRLLERELSHIWSARLQHIYSDLSRLVDEGLVDFETIDRQSRPAKKIYSLTQAGWAALDAWLQKGSLAETTKDDLLARLHCLERGPEVLIGQLDARRQKCEAEAVALRQRIAQIRSADLVELADKLTLAAALSRVEAQASWCEAAIAAIRTQTEQSGSSP